MYYLSQHCLGNCGKVATVYVPYSPRVACATCFERIKQNQSDLKGFDIGQAQNDLSKAKELIVHHLLPQIFTQEHDQLLNSMIKLCFESEYFRAEQMVADCTIFLQKITSEVAQHKGVLKKKAINIGGRVSRGNTKDHSHEELKEAQVREIEGTKKEYNTQHKHQQKSESISDKGMNIEDLKQKYDHELQALKNTKAKESKYQAGIDKMKNELKSTEADLEIIRNQKIAQQISLVDLEKKIYALFHKNSHIPKLRDLNSECTDLNASLEQTIQETLLEQLNTIIHTTLDDPPNLTADSELRLDFSKGTARNIMKRLSGLSLPKLKTIALGNLSSYPHPKDIDAFITKSIPDGIETFTLDCPKDFLPSVLKVSKKVKRKINLRIFGLSQQELIDVIAAFKHCQSISLSSSVVEINSELNFEDKLDGSAFTSLDLGYIGYKYTGNWKENPIKFHHIMSGLYKASNIPKTLKSLDLNYCGISKPHALLLLHEIGFNDLKITIHFT
ncbi:unnamed protein product [Moneuplotes crassus]|uniref:Uncharacterized protein n=1 Tax=Euplotes crassus TaxID=5936 RepID=A0AAD1U826_EUPCR|nr:unnamed protein product [Moneuplotes crassus]